MAELVILARAVTPMTSKAENLTRTVSTAPDNPFISTFLAAASTFSKPFVAPSKRKDFFNLSKVDMLVLAFSSNCLLSNRISTTL